MGKKYNGAEGGADLMLKYYGFRSSESEYARRDESDRMMKERHELEMEVLRLEIELKKQQLSRDTSNIRENIILEL